MATIIEKKNKAGTLISYKIMVCVGRDEQNKQVWRTTTIQRPDGLTPAKERKEIQKGDIFTWAEENARLSRYTVARGVGFQVTGLMVNEDIKHAERQLVCAGYRLAALFNEIFK